MSVKTWSIMIPTRNEQGNIGRCLQSIEALKYDLTKVEIVVIDNGSSDETVSLVRSHSGTLDIKVLIEEVAAVGGLRNLAVQHSTGSRLAFLDADCTPPPSWLCCADEALASSPDAIVGAYYSLPQGAGWPARIWHRRFHKGRSGAVSYIPGGNLLMNRSTFAKVGGFDSGLRSNEDSEFCARARAAGTKVLAIPSLSNIHFGAEKNLRHFAARQWWHGSNVIHRAGFRANHRAVGLAAYTLVCLAVLIAAAVYGRLGQLLIPVEALALPPLVLTLSKGRIWGRPSEACALFVLVLVYAVVRALVLPLACSRALRRGGPAALLRKTPGEKCI